MRLFGKCIHGAKIQILVPQKLWVAISDTAKLKIFAFTFLKPQFGTLTFGICFDFEWSEKKNEDASEAKKTKKDASERFYDTAFRTDTFHHI